MPRRRVNPFLLMPSLSDVGSAKVIDEQGRDFVETLDQIDPDMLDDESHFQLNEFVDIMRGEKD